MCKYKAYATCSVHALLETKNTKCMDITLVLQTKYKVRFLDFKLLPCSECCVLSPA